MSIIESALYGLLLGLAEILPISYHAMQVLLESLLGASKEEPLRDLIVHVCALAGLLVACRSMIGKMRVELNTARKIAHAKHQRHELRSTYDLRLVKTAALPMLLGLLLCFVFINKRFGQPIVILLSVVNGLILFIPDRIPNGNKDARSMSALESMLIGIGYAIGGLPGISRVGAGFAVATACGADRKQSINWGMLLTIPALCAFAVFDVVSIVQLGIGFLTGAGVIGYIVTAIFAFAGAYGGVALLRTWILRAGSTGLAYCSWGMAAFLFVLYLIV